MHWCVFVALSSSSALLLAIIGLPPSYSPGLTTFVVLFSLVIAATLLPSRLTWPTISVWSALALGLWVVLSLRSFLWLGYESQGSLRIQSSNNLGDLSLHLQFIQYLAKVPQYWPESPILSGTPLQYPIGMDFFNSLLLTSGVPLLGGLSMVGLISALVLGWQIWRWAGAFGLCALLFSGGLSGLWYFSSFTPGDWQGEVAWKNILLSMIIPQRNMLFVLPAGILLLRQWQQRLNNQPLVLPSWAEWVLFASLPLFGVHAFLFFVGFIGLAFLFSAEHRWYWMLLGLGTLPLTSLFLYLVTGQFTAASGINWHPGWMQGDSGWSFWVINFGMMLPLLLGAGIFGWQSSSYRILLINCLFWFGVSCLFSLSRWPWDNSKLMLWSWVGLLPIIWSHLLLPLRLPIRILVLIALFLTGSISVFSKVFAQPNHEIIPLTELASTQQALKGVKFTAKIACQPNYNSPLALLGHPVMVGYDGHLWSHGLDYSDKYSQLEKILQGSPEWKQHLSSMNIEYILWGSQERAKYGDDHEWMAYLDIPYEDERVRLYHVPAPLRSGNTTPKKGSFKK
jgi:hypothetical protein